MNCSGLYTTIKQAPETMFFLFKVNKKLLETMGVATRSKDATRGSWPYY